MTTRFSISPARSLTLVACCFMAGCGNTLPAGEPAKAAQVESSSFADGKPRADVARGAAAESMEMDPASAVVFQVVTEEMKDRTVSSFESSKKLRTIENDADDTIYLSGPGPGSVDDARAKEIAEKHKMLRLLDIQFSSITAAGLIELAELPELKVMILGESSVSGQGLEAFQRVRPDCVVRIVPNKRYRSYGYEIDDRPYKEYDAPIGVAMSATAEWRLVRDGIDPKSIDNVIDDDDVRAIVKFLEIQFFTATPFAADNDVNRKHYRLTDEAMKMLARMPNLKAIKIWPAPRITDKGLTYLHGHPSLVKLAIDGTSITEQGFEDFRTAMPHCKLVLDIGG